MPTAGRLIAALAFFIYGWYIGIVAGPLFPENNPPSFLIPLASALGIFCGWKVVGGRAGRGYTAAVGNGLTGAFAHSFWMLFLLAGYKMIRRSMRGLYDGPMDALVALFELMLKTGQDLFDVNLILSIVVGGVIGAWVAEFFAKRFP